MKNNIKNRMNTGGALVILVILVLAMSLFALLAVRSSLNERKLSIKTKESIKNFYLMDAEATELYAQIDGIIAKSSDIKSDLTELKDVREAQKNNGFSVQISDIQYNGDVPAFISYKIKKDEKELNVNIAVNGRKTTIERWSTKAETGNLDYELEIID